MPKTTQADAREAYLANVELRTLRYFVAVAECGSLSAAADVVHVTQPALSRQVRQFEHELGVALFRRTSRALELTAAGREFLPLAQDLLHKAQEAQRAAADLAAGTLSRITVSAPPTTLTDVIAPFLATFGPGDPVPTVVQADGAEALDGLRHETDLAIVTQAPRRPFASRPVAALPVLAYVPAGHAWSTRTRVTVAELAPQPLVVLDPSFRTRQLLDEALTDERLGGPELLECGNPQVAQALAAAGRGVAVVSDDPRFGLHPLRVHSAAGPLLVRLFAAWDPTHSAAARLAGVAERLRAYVAARYPEEPAARVSRASR